MLSTPVVGKINYDLVYEPYEDTFLLLDAIEADHPWIKQQYSKPVILEVGTGSGMVTSFCAQNLSPSLCLATDLNLFACEAALETAKLNGVDSYVDTLRTSLADGIRPRSVDILLFNPPYVPSESVPSSETSDDVKKVLDLALDGGENGMVVTNLLLKDLETIMAQKGAAYILFCASNHPDEVSREMVNRGWDVSCIIERRAGWERLSVLKFVRN